MAVEKAGMWASGWADLTAGHLVDSVAWRFVLKAVLLAARKAV